MCEFLDKMWIFAPVWSLETLFPLRFSTLKYRTSKRKWIRYVCLFEMMVVFFTKYLTFLPYVSVCR